MPIVQVPSYYPFGGPVVGGDMSPSRSASLPVTMTRGRVSPARRRLFLSDSEGDAQELENRRAVERQLAQIQREQTQQWNFDFENGKPLHGRYVWEPATTLTERPSHPLPPPAGIKRPIDNPNDSAPLSKQIRSDSRNVYDTINNNNHPRTIVVSQKKITGKFQFYSLSTCDFCVFESVHSYEQAHRLVAIIPKGYI